MTFKCDPTTRAELDAAGVVTLTQAANVINAALGNAKIIKCFRDSDPAAANPNLTGVEFRRLMATGPLTIVSGRIRKLGKLKGTTIQLAADMGSGASVLRIEGNGRVIEGSLGLSPAAQIAKGVLPANVKQYDFTVNNNFTSINGFGVKADFAILGKSMLATGLGPSAPALTANAPASLEVFDWSSGSGVLVGSLAFNNRVRNWTFEDPEMAGEYGDIGVYQSTQSVMLGETEIGMTLFVGDKSLREDAATTTEPLYQVLGSMARRGTWTSYPFADTYDPATHITRPVPFKAVLKNAAGNVLHTFQMQDGKPINDPSLYQGFYGLDPRPCRPFVNTGMMLPWQNARPRMLTRAKKHYAGLRANAQRPSLGKAYTSSIGVEPLITGGYQGNSSNGLAHIYCAPRWPQPKAPYWPTVQDPYMSYGDLNKDGGSVGYSGWAKGWDYEPGSYSLHNWYTGPGGPRHDRSFIPSIVSLYVTNPDFVRPQENVAIGDMFNGYALGYFNHSNHWVQNVKTMTLKNDNRWLLSGAMKQLFGYYSPGNENPKDPDGIYLKSDMRSGDGPQHRDKDGQFRWSGWGRDSLHDYTNAGWISLVVTSPMHAIASKFDTVASVMMHGPAYQNIGGEHMVRDQAWRWMHWALAWKNASDHPLGFTKAEVEEVFLKYFDAMYDYVYQQTVIENAPGHVEAGLRNLGIPVNYKSEWNVWLLQGTGLGYYMAGVLMLMKQTGLWAALRAKSERAKTMLDFHLANMDRFAINLMLDTSMQFGTDPNVHDNTKVPANMVEVATVYNTRNGQEDLIRGPDGSIQNGSRDVNTFPFMQYIYMRAEYFPEIVTAASANGRLAAAVAKLDQYWADKAAYVNATSDKSVQGGRDFTYGYPGVLPFSGPTELGPA
jgi:hypothetical protein